ncbi:hypothetical protein PAPYR_2825 [Paratrimastix pyriformis]|uniref:Uncharacterized protein n=1 Tax=Paratrimastix pyriformis TaxID=342808 RepID=A0ABQ8UR84_9EUKA|nr:hypothetical protein PAPYR_2825 [Paratrimastix pyriformis]
MFGPFFTFLSLIAAYVLIFVMLVGLVVGVLYLHEQMEEFPALSKIALFVVATIVFLFHFLSLIEGLSIPLVFLSILTHGWTVFLLVTRFPIIDVRPLRDWRTSIWAGLNLINMLFWAIYLAGWKPSFYSRMSRCLFFAVLTMLLPAGFLVGMRPLDLSGASSFSHRYEGDQQRADAGPKRAGILGWAADNWSRIRAQLPGGARSHHILGHYSD